MNKLIRKETGEVLKASENKSDLKLYRDAIIRASQEFAAFDEESKKDFIIEGALGKVLIFGIIVVAAMIFGIVVYAVWG